MTPNESDLELLESYLDDELSSGQIDELRGRLTTDPALATALQALRGQRALRRQILTANEPDDETVNRVLAQIRSSMRHADVQRQRWQWGRFLSAAAALLVIGFGGGWLVHQRVGVVVPSGEVVANGQSKGIETPNNEIKFVGSVNQVLANRATKPYQVVLTDESGRVVGVQYFESQERARQFSDDLTHWQTRQKQLQEGKIKMVNDEY